MSSQLFLASFKKYNVSSFGFPSMMIALMPILASFVPAVPPTLLSFIPPVSGLLAPIDNLHEQVNGVPAKSPVATTTLFLRARGWQEGDNSSHTTFEVMALPPRPSYTGGRACTLISFWVMSTLMILSMYILPSICSTVCRITNAALYNVATHLIDCDSRIRDNNSVSQGVLYNSWPIDFHTISQFIAIIYWCLCKARHVFSYTGYTLYRISESRGGVACRIAHTFSPQQ